MVIVLKDLKVQAPKIKPNERVSADAIQAVVNHIAHTFDPEKIILFGSYAYGQPRPGSDVDLLVVMETDAPKQKQHEIAFSLQAPFSFDLMVWTPQEIAERIPLGDFFLREIVMKGKILYERNKTPLYWSERTMNDLESPPNSYVLEWVQKAEGDYVTATELLKLRLLNITDSACYHCQQCAEKYAKAYLVYHAIEFVRTHNLLELLELCQNQDETFFTIRLQMNLLNNYGVDIRYPGRFTSLEEAEGAVEAMNTIRTFFRTKLSL